jgi:uncharacterized protein (TIGR03435 family)
MRQLVQGTCLLAALAAAAYSQSFEVASVKISDKFRQGGPDSRRSSIDTTSGNLTMRNTPLRQAITWAYKVSPLQISGKAFDEERYDIIAKAAGPAKTEEMRVMLQTLLAERLKLALHRETKEMSAYAIVEAKGGHKLKESELGDGHGVKPIEGKIALHGVAASLDLLAMFLSQPLRTPVVDMTGLKGKYDFTFDVSTEVPMDRKEGDSPPDPVSVLQLLLPKQLGLKLEARKLPIEMLVIDHFEKTPIEN